MKTHPKLHSRPVDVHAALARAHADRAEYIRTAIAAVPALVKRLTGKGRAHRKHQPRAGAWA